MEPQLFAFPMLDLIMETSPWSNHADRRNESIFERIIKAYGVSMMMVDIIAELILRLLRQVRMTNSLSTTIRIISFSGTGFH